jgi:hypothetical protein
MRGLVAIVSAALAFAWFVSPSAAETRVRHHVKHPRLSVAPYRGPYIERPPGDSPGGPNYTACDRINHDRMLVGTCR